MKIIKTKMLQENCTKNKTFHEDIEEQEEVLSDVNLQTASVDTIADAVAAGVEEATENEQTVNPSDAVANAKDLKAAAADIGAEDAVILANNSSALESVNALTSLLDKCLAKSQKVGRQGQSKKVGFNLLVDGLPGSGKTAIFDAWAKSKGLNVTALNASDPDLELVINGMILRDTTQEGNKITKAYANTLAGLERPNSVLFLDEFNRADTTMRRSLLTLINEKSIIVAPDPTAKPGTPEAMGRKVFDNFLFTVACINPPVSTDRGATKLNDAEKSRFWRTKKFDSEVEPAMDFFNKHYTKLITELDPDDVHYMEDLEEYLRAENIALYILSHPTFSFDSREDLEDLYDFDATMLNQRLLTMAIAGCDGDVASLIEWLDDSGLLDRDVEMIKDILKTYPVPTLQELIDNKQHDFAQLGIKGITLPNANAVSDEDSTSTDTANDTTGTAVEDEEEEDDDLFTSSSTGKTAVTAAEAENRIKQFMNSL